MDHALSAVTGVSYGRFQALFLMTADETHAPCLASVAMIDCDHKRIQAKLNPGALLTHPCCNQIVLALDGLERTQLGGGREAFDRHGERNEGLHVCIRTAIAGQI